LLFARNYIEKCEQKYGVEEVEEILDSCHALMNLGVDRYKRPQKISMFEEQRRQKEREKYLQSQVNDLWRTIPKRETEEKEKRARFPAEPQENILYFFEKHAPLLKPWQREILRIVRKVSQYFYPQKQTQVMNEGWASYWHYTILNHLYDEGLVTERFILEFLQSHTNVVFQPPYNSRMYSGINPYALGFAMFKDIRRMCENPDEEDKQWFPDLVGKDWLDTLHYAMENFKDESFISQYLSPKLMREFKFFNLQDHQQNPMLEVTAIHNEQGYRDIRQNLAAQYNLSQLEPNIQIVDVDVNGDRSLTLEYVPHAEIPLGDSVEQMMRHLYRLWGFEVKLVEKKSNGRKVLLHQCPPDEERESA
jgi:spore cortex formation protein SpoVR/YcgB (stage V sporulation)